MSIFSKAMFEPLVGRTFLLHKQDGTHIHLTLTNIEELNVMSRYESFCLTFEAPETEPALPDNSYLLENDQLGRKTLFLSATLTPDPDPNSYFYESVFNIYKDDKGRGQK